MLPCLPDYLHSKNIRYSLISSRGTDDQIILQSNWRRGTPDHIKPKVVVPDATILSNMIGQETHLATPNQTQ